MAGWFDREGRRISLKEANRLLDDLEYRRVEVTRLDDCIVSTVWLGLDHRWGRASALDAPLIFATHVFGGPMDGDVTRWRTEEDAIAGHERTLRVLRETLANRSFVRGVLDRIRSE